MKKIMVAITGASGVEVGIELIEYLSKVGELLISLSISKNGHIVCKEELGNNYMNMIKKTNAKYYQYDDFSCPYASGSSLNEGMIICPCSMGTLGRIANGISSNLIERAADTCIKEKRKLVLVVRELPFSSIHLENMLKLSLIGVIIIPMMMTFYIAENKNSLNKNITFLLGRILDQFKANELYFDYYWSSKESAAWYAKRESYIATIQEKKREKDIKNPNNIFMPASPSSFKGKSYADVKEQLLDLGFTNITTKEASESAGWFDKKDTVEHILVGGKMEFTTEDYFDKDTPIIIYYYKK